MNMVKIGVVCFITLICSCTKIYASSLAGEVIGKQIEEKVTYELALSDIDMYMSEMDVKIDKLNKIRKEYPKSKKIKTNLEKAIEYYNEVIHCKTLYETINENICVVAGNSKQIYNSFSKENLILQIKDCYNKCMKLNDKADLFYTYLEVDDERKAFVNTALSLESKIPYQWDGKPISKGWNEHWNEVNGLDCSGFVGWAYWTVFDINDEKYMSTYGITRAFEKISHDELLPGDLGTITDDGTYYLDAEQNKFYIKCEAVESNEQIANNMKLKKINEAIQKAKKTNPEINEKTLRNKLTKEIIVKPEKVKTYSNHVGIYVGRNEDGQEIWVHCNAKDNTVSVNEGCFKTYYRLSY